MANAAIDRATAPRGPRVAIVHDWLITYAGSERVVERLLALYPQADLFVLIDHVPEADRGFLHGRRITTSFLQKLPGSRRHHRALMPLMPLAVEQFDVSAYDLVLSSSHAVAKGVITGPDQLHICICHSPIRYAWDLQHRYLAEARLTRGLRSVMARVLLHYLRLWDVRTAAGVDEFVAVSRFIARRIRKVYGIGSTVIYPPVDVDAFVPCATKDDFYLTASRMVPYKRMLLVVQAFAIMPDRRLVVIGDGPEMAAIRRRATANVTLLGHQPFSVLRDHMQRARAFVFAAEEDFGIIAVEAQACGTPVIALGRGGALETVRPPDGDDASEASGLFFAEQEPAAIRAAVERFEQLRFDPAAVRRNALRFATLRFDDAFSRFVAERYAEHRAALSA